MFNVAILFLLPVFICFLIFLELGYKELTAVYMHPIRKGSNFLLHNIHRGFGFSGFCSD